MTRANNNGQKRIVFTLLLLIISLLSISLVSGLNILESVPVEGKCGWQPSEGLYSCPSKLIEDTCYYGICNSAGTLCQYYSPDKSCANGRTQDTCGRVCSSNSNTGGNTGSTCSNNNDCRFNDKPETGADLCAAGECCRPKCDGLTYDQNSGCGSVPCSCWRSDKPFKSNYDAPNGGKYCCKDSSCSDLTELTQTIECNDDTNQYRSIYKYFYPDGKTSIHSTSAWNNCKQEVSLRGVTCCSNLGYTTRTIAECDEGRNSFKVPSYGFTDGKITSRITDIFIVESFGCDDRGDKYDCCDKSKTSTKATRTELVCSNDRTKYYKVNIKPMNDDSQYIISRVKYECKGSSTEPDCCRPYTQKVEKTCYNNNKNYKQKTIRYYQDGTYDQYGSTRYKSCDGSSSDPDCCDVADDNTDDDNNNGGNTDNGNTDTTVKLEYYTTDKVCNSAKTQYRSVKYGVYSDKSKKVIEEYAWNNCASSTSVECCGSSGSSTQKRAMYYTTDFVCNEDKSQYHAIQYTVFDDKSKEIKEEFAWNVCNPYSTIICCREGSSNNGGTDNGGTDNGGTDNGGNDGGDTNNGVCTGNKKTCYENGEFNDHKCYYGPKEDICINAPNWDCKNENVVNCDDYTMIEIDDQKLEYFRPTTDSCLSTCVGKECCEEETFKCREDTICETVAVRGEDYTCYNDGMFYIGTTNNPPSEINDDDLDNNCNGKIDENPTGNELPVNIKNVHIQGSPVNTWGTTKLNVYQDEKINVEFELVALDDLEDIEAEVTINGFDYTRDSDLSEILGPINMVDNARYQFEANLKLPSKVEDDTYKLRIHLFDRTHDMKARTFELAINRPDHEIAIREIITTPEYEVKAGRALLVDLGIKNQGQYDEEHLKISLKVPELKISNTFYLDDLESGELDYAEDALLMIPMSAESGVYELVASVEYYEQELETSTTHKFEVIEGDSFNFASTEATVQAVNNEQSGYVETKLEYQIVLDNPGKSSVSYTIKPKLVDWANYEIQPSSLVVVGPESSEVVKFFVVPKDNGVGNHALIVDISTDKASAQIPLQANVYEANISDEKSSSDFDFLKVILIMILFIVCFLLVISFVRIAKPRNY